MVVYLTATSLYATSLSRKCDYRCTHSVRLLQVRYVERRFGQALRGVRERCKQLVEQEVAGGYSFWPHNIRQIGTSVRSGKAGFLLPHALFWFSSLLPGGLKILILNGSGLQIQTSGTAPNIRGVGNPDQRHVAEHPLGRSQRHGMEHPIGRKHLLGRDAHTFNTNYH